MPRIFCDFFIVQPGRSGQQGALHTVTMATFGPAFFKICGWPPAGPQQAPKTGSENQLHRGLAGGAVMRRGSQVGSGRLSVVKWAMLLHHLQESTTRTFMTQAPTANFQFRSIEDPPFQGLHPSI